MSNSSLATYINRTNGNYTSRNGQLVSKIMIHNAFAAGDRYDMTELIESGTAGYHYGVSSDGVIGLYTDEDRAARGCYNTSINEICVHILVLPSPDPNSIVSSTSKNTSDKAISESDAGTPKGYSYNSSSSSSQTSTLQKTNNKLDRDVLNLIIDLVEDICRRNFILECTYTPANREKSVLVQHSWYDSSTNCPGKLESYFADIASSVTAKLKTARTATESESLKARSTIPVGATKPFMVTPDYSAKDIKYDQLRDIGVIGTMIWAGGLFDANRKPRKSYANPNINIQVENAKKYDMPWALYADVRSRTTDEARKECRELYYVISKHSPKLGLWLHLDFTGVSSLSAKEIVNIYYDKILAWGLKGRCGFYTTKAQADLINWPTWTDKFAFWWIAMLPDVESLDSILTPSLFQVK